MVRIARAASALFFVVAAGLPLERQAEAQTCNITGGAGTSPTNLPGAISNASCTTFVLGDGFYTTASITRPGITVVAANKCQAKVAPELAIRANNVTVNGVSITSSGTALSVSNPGARVLNNCIQGFGKTTYGNGIWVFQSALDPSNKVIVDGNALDDWGGAQYAVGIEVGKAADDPRAESQIGIEIKNNRVTNGPTAGSLWSSGIQIFHPALVHGNYVHRVSGPAIQNKAWNSHISCNEVTNGMYDGALYNRDDSNNVWEYNLVHDSAVGIDHFMGNNVVYRGNVFYNMAYFGRIKDQGIGTTNLLIENNTFYNSSGWASWIWDTSSNATLQKILWKNNIWHTAKGSAINPDSGAVGAWDETGNIFWQTTQPMGTTGAGATSLTIDPRFVNPPINFTPQASQAIGKGAPWPLPCDGVTEPPPPPPPPNATILSDNFETGLNWTRTGNTTWYTGSPKVGTHSVRLRQTGQIRRTISLTGRTGISVAFKMGANTLEGSEKVQAQYFDGASWQTIAEILNNSTQENNQLHQFNPAFPG